MNPDILRIAEKWAEGYKDPQVSAYEVIKAALEELSALRDTQERELREKVAEFSVDDLERDSPIRQINLLADTVDSLRAELARRDEVIEGLSQIIESQKQTNEAILKKLK